MRKVNKIVLVIALIMLAGGMASYILYGRGDFQETYKFTGIVNGKVSKIENERIIFIIKAATSAPGETADQDKVEERNFVAVITEKTGFVKISDEAEGYQQASMNDIKIGSRITVYYDNKIDAETFEAKRIQLE